MSPRRALVTGASSGIGRAIAGALARRDVEVILAARRRNLLAAVAAELGKRARVVPLDLFDPDDAVATIRALDDERPIDLVIANAGVGPDLGVDPSSWEAIRGPCRVNFTGAAATLTALLPRMIARRRGHLVGVSSIAALGALPKSAAYCAPKAGLSMLLDCLRLDAEPHGVAVTAVHLGFVDTPMVAHREGPMPQAMSATVAAERIVRALARRPPRIDLPRSLALAARLASLLPHPLHKRLWAALSDQVGPS